MLYSFLEKIPNGIIFLLLSLAYAFIFILHLVGVYQLPMNQLLSIPVFWIFIDNYSLSMAIIPIAYFTLLVGFYFFDISFSKKQLMKIILISFSIFLVQGYLEWLFIIVFKGKYIDDSAVDFSLFSLSWIIGIDNIPSYLLTLCQYINLFDIGFFVLLAMYIKRFYNVLFIKRLGFVFMTYGLGWLGWIAYESYRYITTYY